MTDYSVCNQCGAEIEEKGIHFRDHVFCSDECCEEYEAEFQDKDEPELEELADDEEADDDLENELGYQKKDEYGEDTDSLDDDFDINPEDF